MSFFEFKKKMIIFEANLTILKQTNPENNKIDEPFDFIDSNIHIRSGFFETVNTILITLT